MKAERLLERMRQSSSGWGFEDFATLYSGFGFTARDKGPHTVYIHKEYRQLRAVVARHRQLADGYARYAVELIDQLKELQRREESRNE